MSKLALLGGSPVIDRPLPPYESVGEAEEKAVVEVVRSGCLSGFYGTWDEMFFGGPKVCALEAAWAERFRVAHAVTVNSNTSGLFAAMGAVAIGPGDEVIVPPFSMSATVVAPLVYGAIPVFADIEDETFGLDPEAVRAAITPRTRAILAVNLFGHAARLTELCRIADEHGLFLIEDNAQAPLATEDMRYCGTVGHIGVFSLNHHKHVHTGEGGVCVTDDDRLARRLQMIRNHAEAVVEAAGVEDLSNMYGGNYRMTELSAAVGLVQFANIDAHVGRREALARSLSAAVEDIDGLTAPVVRPNCRHVYYVWALRFDAERAGVSRETFSRALEAEGFPHFRGYVPPLYMLPLFQKRIAMGRDGFPFSHSQVAYTKGMCPVVERVYERELIGFEPCAYGVGAEETIGLCEALRKVHEHRDELAGWERKSGEAVKAGA